MQNKVDELQKELELRQSELAEMTRLRDQAVEMQQSAARSLPRLAAEPETQGEPIRLKEGAKRSREAEDDAVAEGSDPKRQMRAKT